MTNTQISEITEVDIVPYEDANDDKEHLTHVVDVLNNLHLWKPGMTAQDIVDIARMTGQEVESLCGYRWIPQRNPEKYPVCQICMDVAGMIIREGG